MNVLDPEGNEFCACHGGDTTGPETPTETADIGPHRVGSRRRRLTRTDSVSYVSSHATCDTV